MKVTNNINPINSLPVVNESSSFVKGARVFFCRWPHQAEKGKWGTVDYLRDDATERAQFWPKGQYSYSVTFDDGTFDTYVSASNLFLQPPK